MHETPRARRFSGAPVALLALTLVAFPAAAQPYATYEVVLSDGSSVAAATRPLIAMGKVSFLDASNRAVTLSAQVVDIEATRSKLGAPASHSQTWTDRSLARVKGNVQIVGESEGLPNPPESVSEGAAAAEAESDSAFMTEAERLRNEIQLLSAKIQPLGPKDRQRTLLTLRQLELQQELSRILRPPVAS